MGKMVGRTLTDRERRRCELIPAFADWLWESDADQRINFLSAEFEASTGLAPQALLGKRPADLPGAPGGESIATDGQRAAAAAEQPFRDLVASIDDADGGTIWLLLSGTPGLDADGKFAGYRGGGKIAAPVARQDDLLLAEKDRALAEAEARYRALASSEERCRQLVDAASDCYWELDHDGRFTVMSANTETVFGLPPSAYLGKRLAETEGVRFEPGAGRATLEKFNARQPYRDFIYERRLADGRTITVCSYGVPFYGPDGAFLGYRGVARDITARYQVERRDRELGQRYRRIFERGADSYWEANTLGIITYVSASFQSSTGIPVAQLIGRRLNDLPMVKIDPESGLRALNAIKAQQPYADLRHTVTLPDGRVNYVGTSGIPMYDEAGDFIGYCGVSKDISPQVEAETALRRSEARFRELFEIAADHYWEADPQQRITYVSPNYEAATGIPIADIVGKRLLENPNASMDPTVGKRVLTAIKGRQPYRDFVYSYILADGKKRWVSLNGIPIFAEDGSYQGYRGVGTDITSRVEAEHAARLTRRRLEDAFSYVTQPMVVFNDEDRAVAYNQAFVDLHRMPTVNTPVYQGVTFDELVEWQQKFGFFVEGAKQEKITPAGLLEVFRSGKEHTYHLRDGRWMLVVYRPLPGHGRLGLWTDVTAIKRAEAEHRTLEAQLHHSQRLEALGTLAGGAAHEINNALLPAITLSKLMLRHQPAESRERRNLELILTGAERSRDLVKQILAFSRKDEEERPKQTVDLASVLAEALRLLYPTVQTSIRFVDEITPSPPIHGDPGQLQQVIVNLITNAAQAIGEMPGAITISLRSDGEHVRLSIADTGCGMDELTAARVFEPFFTTKPVGEGTGLGLSVVHGIIKAHGGRIELKTSPGHGTCFDILLPPAFGRAREAAVPVEPGWVT
jgi:PAS domain S-box-containing protein